MSAITRNLKFTTTLLVLGFVFVLLFSVIIPHFASATTQEELFDETQKIENEISSNEKILAGLAAQKNTLKNKLAALKAEIDNANKQIELTEVKVKKLILELEATEKELIRQKAILAKSIRTLYIEGDVSTIELLLGSDNFSDFFDQQEYLSTLKQTVQESANKVEGLKLQLEEEKVKQEDLLREQVDQKRLLDIKRNEQAELLDRTQGKEAQYQAISADLENKRKEAELALASFIASGNFVNLGPIAKGEVLGTVGNTGYSTGPHLHFEVRLSNGSVTDPKPFINNQGWLWPVPATPWQINGGNDFGTPGPYYSGYHPGIDTGYGGASVVAMSSGAVIARGCSQDYLGTPAYGYMVMIDHGNGYKSLYAHMLPPDIPQYSHCNYSYGF
jgi:septal ring factor EnvC (AmiA/AmiB activator)